LPGEPGEQEAIIIALPFAISWMCVALALAGSVYALAAGIMVRRFARRPAPLANSAPSVTILKPLHGAEPGLHDNLASFCAQDYAGPVQIIFGVQDPADAALAVVRRVMADFPTADICLVVDPSPHGANRKIANLINMAKSIRHDIVVLADSDMRVERDYLARLIGALEQPGIGLVTCLYRGMPAAGLWSRLASMAIDYHFLPSVLFGLSLGIARPCFGSTIALRRDMLTRIGGFEAFADHLADDNAIGEAVRGTGQRVAIPTMVIAHACPTRGPRDLFHQELRWARTIRAIDPLGFLGSVVTHPLPFALLAVGVGHMGVFGALVVGGVIACRLVLQAQVDHLLGLAGTRWRLGPLRDLLSFLVFVASLFGGAVSWRGHRYRVGRSGILIPLKERA
jgi:ceramide glucosyltransferase